MYAPSPSRRYPRRGRASLSVDDEPTKSAVSGSTDKATSALPCDNDAQVEDTSETATLRSSLMASPLRSTGESTRTPVRSQHTTPRRVSETLVAQAAPEIHQSPEVRRSSPRRPATEHVTSFSTPQRSAEVTGKQAMLQNILNNFRISTPEFHSRLENRRNRGGAIAGIPTEAPAPVIPRTLEDHAISMQAAPTVWLAAHTYLKQPEVHLCLSIKHSIQFDLPRALPWMHLLHTPAVDTAALSLAHDGVRRDGLLHGLRKHASKGTVHTLDDETCASLFTATTMYHCYPLTWMSEWLLNATAGVSNKIKAAIVKEWRDTAASSAATSRKTHVMAVSAPPPPAPEPASATKKHKKGDRSEKRKAVSPRKPSKESSVYNQTQHKSAEALLAERLKAKRKAVAEGESTNASISGKRPRSPETNNSSISDNPAFPAAKRLRGIEAVTDSQASTATQEVTTAYSDADLDLIAAVLKSGWWNDEAEALGTVPQPPPAVEEDEDADASNSTTLRYPSYPSWWPGAHVSRCDFSRFDHATFNPKTMTVSLAGGGIAYQSAGMDSTSNTSMGAATSKQQTGGLFGLPNRTGKEDKTLAPTPIPKPKVLATMRATDFDAAAEWTRRTHLWQVGLVSAWCALKSGQAGSHFFVRFGPSEDAGNVILVCHASMLGGISDGCCAVVCRSSRSLRMRLRERRINFATPFDETLQDYDLGGNMLAASVEELQALNDASDSTYLRVNDVDRMRAQQAIALIERTGIATTTLRDAKPTKRDALRGTPSSSTSVLLFDSTAATAALLQCLMDSVAPIPSIAHTTATATAMLPPIPLSLFAVVDTNAVRGMRNVRIEKDVDVPQIIAPFAFLGSQCGQLRVEQRTRASASGLSAPAAAPSKYLLRVQGVILPGVEEVLSVLLAASQSASDSKESTIEHEEHLVTAQLVDRHVFARVLSDVEGT